MQMEVERKVLAFWSITVLGLTRKQSERKMIDREWLARQESLYLFYEKLNSEKKITEITGGAGKRKYGCENH
jgi:hypothetical protein